MPKPGKPNILIIWGDDIGWFNVSAYNHGVMGYRTPNIDRIAKEGIMFTDYYAEQSCTAGRSSFITGQATLRTGLSKVGIPGATIGLQPQDITIAEALKPLGYATGQFGNASAYVIDLQANQIAAPELAVERNRGSHDSPLEGNGFELVWGFCCQVVVSGLWPVFCSEQESRSSSRRLRSGLRSARKGVKGPKCWQSLAACRLAALVFRSALRPEHAQRR
jgi:hypothetical protein